MNQTLNLAIILDLKLDSGGALHMSQSHLFFLEKLNKKRLNIFIIVTNKDLYNYLKKKYKLKIFFYDKDFFFIKLLNYLYKKIVKFIPILSHFEYFLKKKNINLVYFSSPSYLVLLFKKLNFIYTVFDLIDKKLANLPEHGKSIINLRNKCYFHASSYAKKISITNENRRKIFIKNYNCLPQKIFTIQFPPTICLNKEKSQIIKIKFKDKKINSFIFYPAQYWSHKNHSYIIRAMKRFRSSKLKNLGCVFSGADKGSLDYLKKLSIKEGIENKVTFYNYLSNAQIKYLYKKCFCVIFPSLIGFDSFPLYETFFFKKIVIYNKDIIDKSLAKNIIPLNIKNNKDLEKRILDLLNNKKKYQKYLSINLKLYKKKFFKTKDELNSLILN